MATQTAPIKTSTRKSETKRGRLEILRGQLELERSSFLPHWRDLGDYIVPRRPRFAVTDVNRGDRRNQKIINSAATIAQRTLRSGMMAGITSPARPWFRLTTPDPDLAEFGAVKEWLYFVTQRLNTAFLRSNLYKSLPVVFGDMGNFATAAMAVEESFDGDTIRTTPFPIGSYMISTNDRGRVDVFLRDFRMTVRQLVTKFGEYSDKSGRPMWERFSPNVKWCWDNGEYETWVDVCHVIQPNELFNEDKIESKFKKYASCYYERGMVGSSAAGNMLDSAYDTFLRESGFSMFPILCPRWEVNAEDAYGTDCPGMTALGDIKAMQFMEKKKAKAIDKMIDPPMIGPAALRAVRASILPGDLTYDDSDSSRGFRPAHLVDPKVGEVRLDIREGVERIQRAYFEDLFLMLALEDRREITAREVQERHEEKLMALGPVLEQTNQDLLDPLIDITFDIMLRQGQLPPPPPELEGMDLKVEYVSMMAEAQKLIGTSVMERFIGQVSMLQPVYPEITDKVDIDNFIDRYAERLSIDPDVINTDEETGAIRTKRAQQAQAMQMAQTIKDGSQAAKNLAQAPMEGDNALTRVVNQAANPSA